MIQMTGLDAMFLLMETPNSPQHVGSLSIFDPSTVPDGGTVRFKDIIERVTECGNVVPFMRRRVVEVPFNLDFPYWIEDEEFSPEYHIRHVALPSPGDWRQLCILAARIYAIPLDRSRPLWETWFIEGLDNIEGVPSGSFAMLQKVHHACVDGRSMTDIGSVVSDPTPEVRPIKSTSDWKAEPVPRPYQLLKTAQLNALKKPGRVLDLLRHTAPRLPDTLRGLLKGDLKLPPQAPRTCFNGTISKHRTVDSCTFDLSRIKAVKSAAGATVNDVVLAIISSALRRYLLEKSELPEESLVTMCPINVRDKSKLAMGGNQVASMPVALRTDVADPKERLLAITSEVGASKEITKAIGAQVMVDGANLMSAGLTALGTRLASRLSLANRGRVMFNTVTTNVPGPQQPMYFLGARQIHRGLSLGIPSDATGGLFHIINSYDGALNISITGCRDMLPNPAIYASYLFDSFDELEKAWVKRPAKHKKAAPRRAAAKKKAPTKGKSAAKPKSAIKRKTAARKKRD